MPPHRKAEQELKAINARFRALNRRFERRDALRRWLRRARTLVPLLVIAGVVSFGLWKSPWPVTTTVRHWLAVPSCAMARAVGLAPAAMGDPGYWDRHDRDGDGTACEPMPES